MATFAYVDDELVCWECAQSARDADQSLVTTYRIETTTCASCGWTHHDNARLGRGGWLPPPRGLEAMAAAVDDG